MQGRDEVEEKILNQLEVKIAREPKFVQEWFFSLRARKVSIKSCRDYLNKVTHFLNSINKDHKRIVLKNITSLDISRYFITIQYKEDGFGRKQKTSDSYINSVWFALNNFFTYHAEVGNLNKVYMNAVKPKKSGISLQKKKPLLKSSDFKKMLCHIPGNNTFLYTRNKAILLLYMTTGMRRDALCQSNITDIDFLTREMTIEDKGEKIHTYILNDETMNAIYEWLKSRDSIHHDMTDALFISYQGKRITGNSVYNMITECSQNALGEAISPHKLRSGLCSILYKETGNIEFVRRAIGHSNIATTQRYIITDENEKEVASEIMARLI